MKKPLLSAILFILIFTLTYLTLTFLIPGLRIKLEATPVVYFIKSLQHMSLFKGLLSLAAGILAAVLSFLLKFK